ncbi:MAG: hypothetical protein GX663_09680 [Clostridiales bacterium]|nr:hypothetical protein [Clostridiales bacterium]
MTFIRLLFVLLLLIPVVLFAAYLLYKSAEEFAESREKGTQGKETQRRKRKTKR